MAIKYLDAKRITALSTDTLPTNLPAYTIAEFTDTRKYNWWTGTLWHPQTGRSLFCGGYFLNAIEYVLLETLSDGITFGDLTEPVYRTTGVSSETRGVACCGKRQGGGLSGTMDYVTIATAGNATDFGDALSESLGRCSYSDLSRGVIGGGRPSYAVAQDNPITDIEYITIATTGNGTDFGDLTQARYEMSHGASNLTRGMAAGGAAVGGSRSDVVDYVTIQTLGTAGDFGNLSSAREEGPAGTDNLVRAVWAGGQPSGASDVIDYFTIATTGNSTDFGNLVIAREESIPVKNNTRAAWSGRSNSTSYVTIDYITVASVGNAADFGDLAANRRTGVGLNA